MKIAYLMNGVIGGLTGKNSDNVDADIKSSIVKYTSSTHKYLKNTNNDIDYFIFSWEPNLEQTYINCYSPKNIKCINQIVFDMPPHYEEYKNNSRVQAHYSRWYGAKQVMNMCKQYVNENNIKYDLVINARLDLCYHHPIDLNIDINKFHISKPINLPNYNWPGNNEVIDHIFASNFNNMETFLNLFDNINVYTQPDQCPRWKIISNHFLSVWHLRKIGLLNTNIINESFTNVDSDFSQDVDYHIFRYENINKEELKKRIHEL